MWEIEKLDSRKLAVTYFGQRRYVEVSEHV